MPQGTQGTTFVIDFDNNALDPLVSAAVFETTSAVEFGVPMIEAPNMALAAGLMVPKVPGDVAESAEFTTTLYFENAKDYKTAVGQKATVDRVFPAGQKYTGKAYMRAISISEPVGNTLRKVVMTWAWAGGSESPTYGAGA